MLYFKAKTTVRNNIPKILSRFTSAVVGNRGTSDFFRELAREPWGITGFFAEMFNSRGSGGSFYGRGWEPLLEGYVKYKARNFFDTRIGFKTGALFESLVDPGGKDSAFKVYADGLIYGSLVTNPKTGERYSGQFSEKRPVWDEQTANDLKDWLINSAGFRRAVDDYKSVITDYSKQ